MFWPTCLSTSRSELMGFVTLVMLSMLLNTFEQKSGVCMCECLYSYVYAYLRLQYQWVASARAVGKSIACTPVLTDQSIRANCSAARNAEAQ